MSYNGPSTQVSRLCADKIATKQAIDKAQIPGVRTAKYFGYTLALLSQQTHIDLLRNNIVHHI